MSIDYRHARDRLLEEYLGSAAAQNPAVRHWLQLALKGRGEADVVIALCQCIRYLAADASSLRTILIGGEITPKPDYSWPRPSELAEAPRPAGDWTRTDPGHWVPLTAGYWDAATVWGPAIHLCACAGAFILEGSLLITCPACGGLRSDGRPGPAAAHDATTCTCASLLNGHENGCPYARGGGSG